MTKRLLLLFHIPTDSSSTSAAGHKKETRHPNRKVIRIDKDHALVETIKHDAYGVKDSLEIVKLGTVNLRELRKSLIHD